MKSRVFRHRYQVPFPLPEVIDLFCTPSALAQMTPPPVTVSFQRLPPILEQNAIMEMSIGVGPLRIPWTACFIEVAPDHFVDIQTVGPFRTWHHRHEFRAITPDVTEIRDCIAAEFGAGTRYRILCQLLWLGLPWLFLYRRLRTRTLLAHRRSA